MTTAARGGFAAAMAGTTPSLHLQDILSTAVRIDPAGSRMGVRHVDGQDPRVGAGFIKERRISI